MIVERLFDHVVETSEEVRLIRNVIFDRWLNADFLFKFVDSFYEVFKLFFVCFAAELERVRETLRGGAYITVQAFTFLCFVVFQTSDGSVHKWNL